MTTQYDNPKLWVLVSDEWGKDYVSVAAAVPEKWTRTRWPNDELRYVSGEYKIRGRAYGNRRPDGSVMRRTYVVYRQDVELPLSFTGSLADAKARAVNNAQGLDRVHVA